MNLNHALKIIARRYAWLKNSPNLDHQAEAAAIKHIVAQAIVNDDLGCFSDKEMREHANLLLNWYLPLYPDANYKKKVHAGIRQTRKYQAAKENNMKAKSLNVSPRHLEQLRMLADWHLEQLGYDPQEVTSACLIMDAAKEVGHETDSPTND